MKTLYIVDYWMPFPSSEYGGVQIVVAEDDAQCERMVAETVEDSDYYKGRYPDYLERIAEVVKQAKRLPVDAEPGRIYQFIT